MNSNDNINNIFTIADARDTLDRIIGFINSCDSKASIMLGIIGVIASICLNDSIVLKSYHYIVKNTESSKCIVFFVITCLIVAMFLFGILNLISVLFARIKESEYSSKIYFADIAKNTSSNEYKQGLLKQNESEKLDDYIKQIYINSTICEKKYKLYNRGIKIVCSSLLLLFIEIVIFICVR